MAKMRWELLGTSVGLKLLMAASGLLWTGMEVLHMAGNLLVFAGPETINGYGAVLQGSPLLWVMRAGLLALLAVHVTSAALLTRRAREAKGRYQRRLAARDSTLASRTMRWGGLFILLFLVYHLVHIYGPLHAAYVPGDVHHNLVVGLSDPLAGSLYVLATLVFGLHLHHGTWSMFRTLGLERVPKLRRVTGAGSALITLGFLAPCVASMTGLLSA
ncbi:MAG: succinate dehydrogenase cytochrome b subunit [Sandaracinaceae bacterium]